MADTKDLRCQGIMTVYWKHLGWSTSLLFMYVNNIYIYIYISCYCRHLFVNILPNTIVDHIILTPLKCHIPYYTW